MTPFRMVAWVAINTWPVWAVFGIPMPLAFALAAVAASAIAPYDWDHHK